MLICLKSLTIALANFFEKSRDFIPQLFLIFVDIIFFDWYNIFILN